MPDVRDRGGDVGLLAIGRNTRRQPDDGRYPISQRLTCKSQAMLALHRRPGTDIRSGAQETFQFIAVPVSICQNGKAPIRRSDRSLIHTQRTSLPMPSKIKQGARVRLLVHSGKRGPPSKPGTVIGVVERPRLIRVQFDEFKRSRLVHSRYLRVVRTRDAPKS